ncbi:hypothetical protein [Alkalibacillus haloalkaliphilus]|uniref:Uncharacterized protein n=1 Tax=Alkalibacillus haloalkaliphilus TaxID=94136 RepID=A0A511W2V5_9BACI|nr:hypothetical protein [Alkalibacillus haloalkaliphilus]GEN45416.1 hypothetical protein AHA02nite_11920 [Alkalibacillus haloalkaliphilus]
MVMKAEERKKERETIRQEILKRRKAAIEHSRKNHNYSVLERIKNKKVY